MLHSFPMWQTNKFFSFHFLIDSAYQTLPNIFLCENFQSQSNSKVSSMFGGTQDKCVTCKKTVYPLEKVGVDGNAYHKACFKCSHGGCVITPSNYVAHEHQLYCKHHSAQLFMAKGNFSQFDKHHEPENGVNGVAENTTEV